MVAATRGRQSRRLTSLPEGERFGLSTRAAAQRLKFAPAGIAPDELSMGMFGEFEIATCNRAAEALRPERRSKRLTRADKQFL